MPNFSKANTKESGGKFADRDWTFTNCRWIEETAASGFTGIYFASDLKGVDGKTETKRWLLGDADKLRSKLVVTDDGTVEDVDEDNLYVPRTNDETQQLFNSLEDAGVSAKILANIGANPGGLDGVIAHLVDKPTGRKQKKNGVETQYDQTWLVAESLVEGSGGGKKKATAVKPSAAAKAKIKAAAAAVEDEEEPEESEEEEESEDPVEAAAIATIQTVLASPKKYIPTYNAKQNGGGVTTVQMSTAALGNAIPKEHRGVGKPAVQKLVKDKKFGGKFDGELWSFDADSGVYSALDE